MNSATSILKLITGETVLRDESSKCFVFIAAARGTIGESRTECTLGVMSMNHPDKVRRLSATKITSVAGYPDAVGGAMTDAQFTVPDGTVLKIVASIRYIGGQSFTSNLFLRVRGNAPLQRVKVKQTRGADVCHQGGLVEGRFDILTPDEADALGCVQSKFAHLHRNPGARQHLFAVEEVAPAKTTVQQVATVTGEVAVIEVEKRARKFRL